ncbi:type II CAAX prenyl endopeptidase Rce1 family protein [Sphingobacterium sp. NGMCC 1.201703]|uniref:CPBP family glutamic-type intramembrane protease n=1 Tax=Sphingobacterium sp. NGMCC 1.201703 TaxID=3388657 RepID=UPI0039FCDCD1
MQKYINRLFNLPVPYLYAVTLIAYVVIDVLCNLVLIDLLNLASVSNEVVRDQGILKTFLFAIILGPFFETLLFQFIPVKLLSTYTFFKERKLLIALISALLFALTHTYSFYYFILSFLMGGVFVFFFLIMEFRKKGTGLLHTIFLHAIINLIVFLNKYFI